MALDEIAQLISGQKVDFSFKADFWIGKWQIPSDFANRHESRPRPHLRSDELWWAHSRGAAGWANRKTLHFWGVTDRNFPDEPIFRLKMAIFIGKK